VADGDKTRVEIAFDGGQIMSGLVTAASIDALERALGGGEDGTLQLEAEDGGYTVVLRRVVYVKRFAREARVGFGA
jgi:hypothetical protein